MSMVFHDRRSGADQYWGANDIDSMFPEGIPKRGAPWPQAGRRKHQESYDKEAVHRTIFNPAHLEEIDPRTLSASQPSILRAPVQHYLGPQWKRTGMPYADRHQAGNQFPTVYTRHSDDDTPDEHILLSGHHRAAARLLQGRPLEARHIVGGWGKKL